MDRDKKLDIEQEDEDEGDSAWLAYLLAAILIVGLLGVVIMTIFTLAR